MSEKLPSSKLDIKIIALDLDDTLLDNELHISEKTVSVLQKCAQRGIYVVLCSGRTENAILPYVSQLNIAGTQAGRYVISMNGATIFDLHTRLPIYTRLVDTEILLAAYHAAEKHGLPCQVYDASTIYPSFDNKWTRVDVSLSKLNLQLVGNFAAFLGKGWSKLVVPGEPEILTGFQKELKDMFGDKANIFTSKPFFLEILPPNCGKGEALLDLAENLGIPAGQTMAFGDSMNDLSMIEKATHSVAMLNGLDIIKEKARYITRADNNHDGVGDFIEEFVL